MKPEDTHQRTVHERGVIDAALDMYRRGWFPMYDPESDKTHWVQPRRRALIPLEPEKFRVPRSLRAAVKSGRFVVRTDAAFSQVIRACAVRSKGRDQTWLNDQIIGLFELFHRAGLAHSVEAYLAADPEGAGAGPSGRGPVLVGGLYGLALGSTFCGESMFSRPDLGGTNASKVCLVHLVEHLRRRGFTMLDAQLHNPHLEQFGLVEITGRRYLEKLNAGFATKIEWQPFEPELVAGEWAG